MGLVAISGLKPDAHLLWNAGGSLRNRLLAPVLRPDQYHRSLPGLAALHASALQPRPTLQDWAGSTEPVVNERRHRWFAYIDGSSQHQGQKYSLDQR